MSETTQHRDVAKISKDILQQDKIKRGLLYGLYEKELNAIHAKGTDLFQFMKDNANQKGQLFPHREQQGKPMSIKMTIEVGFKEQQSDKGFTSKKVEIHQYLRSDQHKAYLESTSFEELPTAKTLAKCHNGQTSEIEGWNIIFKGLKQLNDGNIGTAKTVLSGSSQTEIREAAAWWSMNSVSNPKKELEAVEAKIAELKKEQKEAVLAE